jgi:hypothetical protein
MAQLGHEAKTFVIKRDTAAGFYLFVFQDGVCVQDYLQDTLEQAIEMAHDDFGVPKDAWVEEHEPPK